MKINVKFEKHSKGCNFSVEVEGENSTQEEVLAIAKDTFEKVKDQAAEFESSMSV